MNKDQLLNKLSLTDDDLSGSNIWEHLPDYVGGPNWRGEILDAASNLSGYIYEDKDYSADDLSDYVGELANGECEDYYVNINKRVQELSLWAYPALDLMVADMDFNHNGNTLTDLNSLYLYAAMRELYDGIISWLFSSESVVSNA
jgi:hypothetical protein